MQLFSTRVAGDDRDRRHGGVWSGRVVATRVGLGLYAVDFEGLESSSRSTETVQVTAYGPHAATCATVTWGVLQVGSLGVAVECRDASGSPTDSRFTVVVIE